MASDNINNVDSSLAETNGVNVGDSNDVISRETDLNTELKDSRVTDPDGAQSVSYANII